MDWEKDRDSQDAAAAGGGLLRGTCYSLLSMGWRVGKKLAITGAAITSAPVVLPPLFICSTIWFALSVPFGICFAGYAATNRIMKALLSPAPTPMLMDRAVEKRVLEDAEMYDLIGVEGEEEAIGGGGDRELEREEVAMVDRGLLAEMPAGEEEEGVNEAERVAQEVQRHDVVGVPEEEEAGGGVQYREIESEELPMDDTVVLEQMPAVGEEKSIHEAERYGLVGLLDEEEAGGVEGWEVQREEVSKDDRGVFEEMPVGVEEKSVDEAKGEVQEADIYDLVGIQEEEKAGGAIPDGQVESEAVPKDDAEVLEEMPVGEEKSADEVGREVPEPERYDLEERREIPVEGEEEGIAAEVRQPLLSVALVEREVVLEQSCPFTDTEYPSAEAEEMEQAIPVVAEGEGFPVASVSFIERELIVESPDAGQEPSLDAAFVSGGERIAAMPVTVESLQVLPDEKRGPEVVVRGVEVTEPTEDLYNEEKIWEQIDALRTIVGYTAARHLSFMEELKALYIFTGVEPTISTEGPSDLVDVSNKLHFLKSVVGVK